jgi:uncharacterized glyoxalase superfamily protein PhnB
MSFNGVGEPSDLNSLECRQESAHEVFQRAGRSRDGSICSRLIAQARIALIIQMEEPAMTPMPSTTQAIIYPTMRYRDARAMIDWLERAFGFERRVVYDAEDGSIAHAEMSFGTGIIMLGSVKDDFFGRLVKPPADVGGTTQSVYIAVPDADAVFARAKAAGAEILMGLTDQPYGSRDFICRDPEGQVWCFGTYAPQPG